MSEWILQVIGMMGVGVGAYAAIRADLAALHARVDSAASAAESAHRRLDTLIDR